MAATKIKGKLALASCTLLAPAVEALEAIENDWEVNGSFLTYRENDRVNIDKFIAQVDGRVTEEDSVKVKVVLDSMTGATPTGAVRTSEVVAVSGVSGGGINVDGQASSLANFSDTRLAGNLDWTRELSRLSRLTLGTALSVETDYVSVGGSIKYDRDTSNRLRTYTVGLSFNRDEIDGAGGGTPDPLSEVTEGLILDTGDRDTFDIMAGVTQIFNPRTIGQFNLFATYSDGYHTDPYKVISAANAFDVELERYYESRPSERMRYGFYSKVAHHLQNENTIHLSYRYYQDDWEVNSHTVDFTYRFNFDNNTYFEPHARFYKQSAAEFYQRTLALNEFNQLVDLPEFVSADYRLDDFFSYTVGGKYGRLVNERTELSARLEYMHQEFRDSVFSQNTAIWLQLTASVKFF